VARIAEVIDVSASSPLLWRVLCRSRLLHHWRTVSSPDGERYRACSVCGRERFSGVYPVF
jgi:hypothetical protein